MPYLQILPVSGARLINLFRLLAVIGLLSYPFQSELRSLSERSTVILMNGAKIKGVVEEYSFRATGRGYRILNPEFPDGRVPESLKPLAAGTYVVSMEDVREVEPIYVYHIRGLITLPLRFFLIFNIVWLLHLPALLIWPAYEAAGAAAILLNMIHASITEQNHQELTRFLMRVHLFRWKLLLSLNTGQLPHLDIHGREKTKLPLRFTATIDSEFSRMQILIRFAVLLLIYALYYVWTAAMFSGPLFFYIKLGVAGLLILPFALIVPGQLLLWIFLALNRPAPDWLLEIMYRPQRWLLSVICWWQGLTSDPRVILSGWKSILSTETGSFDPAQSPKIDMNLLVLLLLILFSGGVYTLIWTGRTARMMQDDPFTVILVSLMGGLLPLSIILARYYRRTEIMLKMMPSVLVEFLMMLPVFNLILGPFVIQHGLNLYAKLQAKTG